MKQYILTKEDTGTDMERLEIKVKIKKWEKSFIRDRWGNLTKCYWNKMTKEEMLKLEALL